MGEDIAETLSKKMDMEYKLSYFTRFVCDKWYEVIINENRCIEKTIVGYLLNWNSGNLDILTEKGIYHIPHSYVRYMKPTSQPIKMSQEFQRVINVEEELCCKNGE